MYLCVKSYNSKKKRFKNSVFFTKKYDYFIQRNDNKIKFDLRLIEINVICEVPFYFINIIIVNKIF